MFEFILCFQHAFSDNIVYFINVKHVTFIKRVVIYLFCIIFMFIITLCLRKSRISSFLYWVVALGFVEMRSLDSGVGGGVDESFKYAKMFISR